MQMKRKKKWIKRTKTIGQQADEDGWVYVYACKIIRGWNSIWVEGGRGAPEADGETILHRYIPSPTGFPRGSIERCSDNEIEQGLGRTRALL